MNDYQFYNNYKNAVRRACDKSTFTHDLKDDECQDLTLVSQRVYGNRLDYDVVMIACGVDSISGQVKKKRIKMIPPFELMRLKHKYEISGVR